MKLQAQWIWHNGDLEILQLNRCLTSRYERGIFIPPFWRMDDFSKNVKFSKEFELAAPETIHITANGKFNAAVEDLGRGKGGYARDGGRLELEPGKYRLTVSVYNAAALPALFVEGETVCSGAGFLSTANDHAAGFVGHGGFYDKACPPGEFRFHYKNVEYTVLERDKSGMLIDCGRELVGRIGFERAAGDGKIKLYYGESLSEARDTENCELTDVLDAADGCRAEIPKAMRYARVCFDRGVTASEPKAEEEFVPQARSSRFRCSDEKLNRIYETALRTLALNTREFFLDGIKRDRWVWAGDAYQSCLMNYYSFFDLNTARRTITALAGKPPVTTYMNHIMEYSFYWIVGLWDYYMYAGDSEFVRRMLPTALEIVGFTERTRRNASGFIEGRDGDWVFVDWGDLDNSGEVSVEQIVYLKALKTVVKLCRVFSTDGAAYEARFNDLREKLFDRFWDGERQVFRYALRGGKPDGTVEKHPHILALIYGFLDGEKREGAIRNALLDPAVRKIVTPYMRFYELGALCLANRHDFVLNEIRDYWGGMLDEGATSFWETYDATQKGAEKYAMYGRKYGKSLCHAWGAGPLYILGRHFIGLEPAEPGFKSFTLTPVLSDLEFMEAELPLPQGEVKIYMDAGRLTVFSNGADGVVRFRAKPRLTDALADKTDGEYLYYNVKKNRELNLILNGRANA
ncbi:MAG: hypothetical protein LBL66_03200 [Clostridiales bacterium]|nr:hypothetical protein [Clostridiales bacterium]